MEKKKSTPVVLSVAPATRGIGYAVFENEKEPIDWGIKTARVNKNTRCERHVESLISFYQPDVLVIEDFDTVSKRARATELNAILATLALHLDVEVVKFKKSDVKAVFGQFGGTQKQSIAKTITKGFPELKHRMPRYRHAWLPEAHSMVMFEAFALGLTYYYQNN